MLFRSSVLDAPLWNHEITTLTFTPYTSSTLDSIPGQPDGVSKLCLSCHDGSVALDSFGGASGSSFMTGDHAVGRGGDLTDDHPISMVYDAGLVTADPELHPVTNNVTVGEGAFQVTDTIENVLLDVSSKLQCSSCHDVHNTQTVSGAPGDPLLRMSKAGSTICLNCHIK